MTTRQARYRRIDTRASGFSQGDAFHFHSMTSSTTKRLHIWTATLGAGAFVIIGLLSALFTPSTDEAPLAAKTMQVGITTTLEAVPPKSPEVARAVPAIRGPAK